MRACENRKCSPCKVGLKEYPGDTHFLYARGCYQFACECQCGGHWRCQTEKPMNTCSKNNKIVNDTSSEDKLYLKGNSPGTSDIVMPARAVARDDVYTITEETTNQYACQKCQVGGQEISYNEIFSVRNECIEYTQCMCDCRGKWKCREKRNVCNGEDHTASGSERNVSMSVWIEKGGSNQTKIVNIHGDKTGDGHLQIDTRYLPTFTSVGSNTDRHERLQRLETSQTPHSEQVETPSQSDTETRCQSCTSDSRTYPVGAMFDKKRGCKIYRCVCRCNGNYRCRVLSDHECSPGERQGSCGNCIHKGLSYPGNMRFTYREGCMETLCDCGCDGRYTCGSPKPIQGCNSRFDVSATETQPNFDTRREKVFPGTGIPIVPSYRTHNGRIVYQSSVRNGRGITNHRPIGQPQSRQNMVNARTTRKCQPCFVENVPREVNKAFVVAKDCVLFDCFCSCNSSGSSWMCKGKHDPSCFYQGDPSLEAAPPVRRSVYNFGPTSQNGMIEPLKLAPQKGNDQVRNPTRRQDHERVDYSKNNDVTCVQCHTKAHSFEGDSKFLIREGCLQKLCDCYCNGTWECHEEFTVNICQDDVTKTAASVINECVSCNFKGKMIPGGTSFEKNDGCSQQVCNCGWDGKVACQSAIDVCGSTSTQVRIGKSEPQRIVFGSELGGDVSDERCMSCDVDGRTIKALSTYTRRGLCHESLCYCACTGRQVCPLHATVNVCELNDPTPEKERKACKVGNRTFSTHVFALVKNCRQRVCVCNGDGTWTCKRNLFQRSVC